MENTEQRALYPWETPQYSGTPQCSGIPQCSDTPQDIWQPKGCEQPLQDSVTFPEPEIQPNGIPKPPAQPLPAAPTYVLAHAFQDNQVTLLWGEAGGADGYLIQRGESQGRLKPVAAVEQASYIDNQVRPGKTYCYAVRAYNEHGQSAPTPTATVTLPVAPGPEPATEPEPGPSPAAFAGKRLRVQKKPGGEEAPSPKHGTAEAAPAVPEAPTELCATVRGTHLVELQWQGGQREGVEYRLYRSETPWCSYGLIAETRESRFLDTVPEAGTKYYYFAQAVWEGRSSGASAMAEALTFPPLPPPEPPERLRAAPVNPDAIELRWTHARGAAAYVISARLEGEDFRVVGHTLDGGYLHENLPADVSVDYRVQSYHDTGVSEPSAICTARTGAQRPPNARPARPAPPPQNRRFPAFSLQALQGRG